MGAKYGKGTCAHCGGFRHAKTTKYCSRRCHYDASVAQTKQRFEARIHKTDTCWLWTGPRANNGYGKVWTHNRTIGAHRCAYELFVGPVPEGLHICHRCDVKLCVNPAHLFAATHADNMHDKIVKGREEHGDQHWTRRLPEYVARGERSGAAQLTEQQVISIRAARAQGETLESLGRRFGVSGTTINDITKRKTWTHI